MVKVFLAPKLLKAPYPLLGLVSCFPSEYSPSQNQAHLLLMSIKSQLPSKHYLNGNQGRFEAPRHGPPDLGSSPTWPVSAPQHMSWVMGLAEVCGK